MADAVKQMSSLHLALVQSGLPAVEASIRAAEEEESTLRNLSRSLEGQLQNLTREEHALRQWLAVDDAEQAAERSKRRRLDVEGTPGSLAGDGLGGQDYLKRAQLYASSGSVAAASVADLHCTASSGHHAVLPSGETAAVVDFVSPGAESQQGDPGSQDAELLESKAAAMEARLKRLLGE